ncbi:MAG: glycosyltransferase, partial [Flammeovirgaceae bacterium]|nr:glycosyltransferase [Flammeovirgaceae bacterium]MDW8287716.1 glycosyltransferase [Flammeovirgaceae bacterium]
MLTIFLLTALLLGTIQFFYIAIFSRLIFHRTSYATSTFPLPVSIIIAARNEYANLQKLLPLLLTQKYEADYEILIVNDRSNDDTEKLLKHYQEKHSQLRYISIVQTPKGISPKKHALMSAIAHARYEILLFTDADCLPSSVFWIKKMVEPFNQKNIEVVLGVSQYQKLRGFLNRFIRYETLQTAVQYLSFAISLKPFMGVGRNLAYRKRLFEKSHGFSEHLHVLSGDDDLFVNKVARKNNTAVVLEPEGQTVSFPKTTFREWYAQKKRHLSVGRRYKVIDQLLLGTYMTTLLSYHVFLAISFFVVPTYFYLFAAFWAIRWIIFAIVLHKIARKIGKHNVDWESLLFLPIFDILYVLY